MIYLDNSATTRPDPEVVTVMNDVLQHVYGNPSSLHGLGAKAERLLQRSREAVAETLGAGAGELSLPQEATDPTISRSRVSLYNIRGVVVIL